MAKDSSFLTASSHGRVHATSSAWQNKAETALPIKEKRGRHMNTWEQQCHKWGKVLGIL